MARQTTHQTEPSKPKNVKRDPVASGERDATFNRAINTSVLNVYAANPATAWRSADTVGSMTRQAG